VKRPTIEVVILALTFTVCLFLLLAGGVLALAAITNPSNAALSQYATAMGGIITTVTGALLGLLAGRAGRRRRDPDEDAQR
jgi:hypothetical protein